MSPELSESSGIPAPSLKADFEVNDWSILRGKGCPHFIPHSLLKSHEHTAIKYYGTSLEKLQGKLGLIDLLFILKDAPKEPMEPRVASQELNDLIKAHIGFPISQFKEDLMVGQRFRYAGFYANNLIAPLWNSVWEVHQIVERGIVVGHPKPHGGHEHLIEWTTILWHFEKR